MLDIILDGRIIMGKRLVCALVLVALPVAALAADDRMGVQSAALKWGPAPPGLPPGSQVAIVTGDPSKPEPYVLRVKVPRGYRVMPHTHPTDENVTVLSGTAHIAMGDKFDMTKGDTLTTGGFFTAKQGMQHYFWATSPSVIQVHGIGPFEITYVNPADDPRNKTSAKK
jgi:hypothetical protein